MKKLALLVTALLACSLLAGCDLTLLNPPGYMAKQQSNLMMFSVWLMLLVIVPVIFLVLFFSWKYRRGGPHATYDAEFYHSNKLEVVIWGVPICIIVVLATVTWGSTHLLDPYRPLVRIDTNVKVAGMDENLGWVKRVTNSVIDPGRTDSPTIVETKPLVIEVASLDWKWLFVYPEQGIATINEVAAPVNRPIHFKITSASTMNSFFIPALSGQIYAMPGMQTQLHAVMNKEGAYKGFSANYTGHGFSQMYFYFHGLSNTGFDEWVAKVRASDKVLNRAEYMALDVRNQADERGFIKYFGIRHYGSFEQGIYSAILNMCVMPGSMCASEMMALDLAGGVKDEAQARQNFKRLQYDRRWNAQTQLNMAEFSDLVPGSLLCTTDTIEADLAASPLLTVSDSARVDKISLDQRTPVL